MDELKKLKELTDTLTTNGYLKDQTVAWKYAFDSVNAFICIVNPLYKIKFINKSFTKLLNVTAEELINKDLKDIHKDDKIIKLIESLDNCENNECRLDPIQMLDRWIEPRKMLITDSYEKLVGYMFILEDITDRMRTRNKLKESYARLSFIVNAVDGYIWEKEINKGNELVHTYVDPAFCRDFYGIDTNSKGMCQETFGKTSTELLDIFRKEGKLHTFGDICVSTDKHCAEQGIPCEYFEMGYIEYQKGKPEWFILRVRKTPIFDENGECTGVMGFANNCTKSANAVRHLLRRGIVTGNVKVLDTSTEQAKVYWVASRVEDDSLTHIDFP